MSRPDVKAGYTSAINAELIYSDATLIVANKPAGLLAVPGKGASGQFSFSEIIQDDFPDALIVHRLDMATSGVMLFARGKMIQSQLSRLFREQQIRKRYVAVVSGKINEAGEIDLPLAADWPNRPRQKVDYDNGKRSLTRYSLLSYDLATNSSRIELEPVTGRTHQLRLHLAASGYPILGDQLYGGRSAGRLFLHATTMNLSHPLSAEEMSYYSKAPF